ncbi:MAG: NAD(P)H-dependent glycerol-3-phosphate dehydrogenase [Kiritimatiellia bacterium]
MKVAILGNGGWGTAMALHLHRLGHRVYVWGALPQEVEEIARLRENVTYLKGVPIPEEIRFTHNEQLAAGGAGLVILAPPSRYFRDICRRFAPFIPPYTPVLSLTKGLCEQTGERMSEIARTELANRNIAVLSGPSHAEEVAREIPTAVVAASHNEILARLVQETVSGPRLRVYTSSDTLGVEIGGTVKNIIAIAVGASDGLGFGDNTRAALITRGLAEMTRLGVALGAKAETFSGLSGLGDLVVTCTSRHSRNHHVGEELGRGRAISEILSSMKMVAEGYWNARVIDRIAREHSVEMPITRAVYNLCFENATPADAVAALMNREAKPESPA